MAGAVSSYVPGDSPEAKALAAWEDQAAADPNGRRVIENMHEGIRLGLLSPGDLAVFGRALAKSAAIWARGFSEGDLRKLDEAEQLCRRGPIAASPGTGDYSRVMLFWGLLYHNILDHEPDWVEYEQFLKLLEDRKVSGADLNPASSIKVIRPIAWLTASSAIQTQTIGTSTATATTLADTLRDVLGLARLVSGDRSYLIELQIPPDLVNDTHRPTPLDGLDNPLYLPYLGSGGWGRTDDLRGPRGTPGLPEVVSAPVAVPAEVTSRKRIAVVPRGEIKNPPSRTF